MAETALLMVRTLDRHLSGPADLRLLGGAALILGYGLERGTEDIDLLMEDRELDLLVERANLGEALDSTNRELEPMGLYISHIWGPEQQILTPEWRDRVRAIHPDPPLRNLTLHVLGPLDLVVSKLCRADDGDLADIAYLVERVGLTSREVLAAMRRAVVPGAFVDTYPSHVARVKALLADLNGASEEGN